MLNGNIKIGSSEYGKAREIEVAILKAGDIADTIQLATAAEVSDDLREALAEVPADVQAIIASKFNRAYIIAIQDGHLRPMYHDGERNTAKFQEVADHLQTLPLKAIKARGRPAKVQTVKLDAGKTQYTPAEVEALLANMKGVKVVK